MLALALARALDQVLVLVLVLAMLLAPLPAEPQESGEPGPRLPILEQRQTSLLAYPALALHSGLLSDDTCLEENRTMNKLVACIEDLVYTSTCIPDPCIDLRSLAHIYCSSWVHHKELYILGNPHLRMHPGKLLRSVAHRTSRCIVQLFHKRSRTVVAHTPVHRPGHKFLIRIPICTWGGNQRMSCQQHQDLLEPLQEELALLRFCCSKRQLVSLSCGISSSLRSSLWQPLWHQHTLISKR